MLYRPLGVSSYVWVELFQEQILCRCPSCVQCICSLTAFKHHCQRFLTLRVAHRAGLTLLCVLQTLTGAPDVFQGAGSVALSPPSCLLLHDICHHALSASQALTGALDRLQGRLQQRGLSQQADAIGGATIVPAVTCLLLITLCICVICVLRTLTGALDRLQGRLQFSTGTTIMPAVTCLSVDHALLFVSFVPCRR